MTAVSVHDILIRPVISEKSVAQTERNNYTFMVGRDANKFQIKDAVEAEFKVTVLGVRVLWVKPKQKRRGRRTMGTVPGWRKAVVTIAAVHEWQLHVLHSIEAGQQVERLEHEPKMLVADRRELVVRQLPDVLPSQLVRAGVRDIEATEDVHQRRLA